MKLTVAGLEPVAIGSGPLRQMKLGVALLKPKAPMVPPKLLVERDANPVVGIGPLIVNPPEPWPNPLLAEDVISVKPKSVDWAVAAALIVEAATATTTPMTRLQISRFTY